jgi:hypothetical protein
MKWRGLNNDKTKATRPRQAKAQNEENAVTTGGRKVGKKGWLKS